MTPAEVFKLYTPKSQAMLCNGKPSKLEWVQPIMCECVRKACGRARDG